MSKRSASSPSQPVSNGSSRNSNNPGPSASSSPVPNDSAQVTVCSICWDALGEKNDNPPTAKKPRLDDSATGKKLGSCVTRCGHVFHKECLLNWFKTSNADGGYQKGSCPKCRKIVNSNDLYPLFPDVVNEREEDSPASPQPSQSMEQGSNAAGRSDEESDLDVDDYDEYLSDTSSSSSSSFSSLSSSSSLSSLSSSSSSSSSSSWSLESESDEEEAHGGCGLWNWFRRRTRR